MTAATRGRSLVVAATGAAAAVAAVVTALEGLHADTGELLNLLQQFDQLVHHVPFLGMGGAAATR